MINNLFQEEFDLNIKHQLKDFKPDSIMSVGYLIEYKNGKIAFCSLIFPKSFLKKIGIKGVAFK